jgi:hypothetical protein
MFRPRLGHLQVHILAYTETRSVKQDLIQLCADCCQVQTLRYRITKPDATSQNLEELFMCNNSKEKILFVCVTCNNKTETHWMYLVYVTTKNDTCCLHVPHAKKNQNKNVSDTPDRVTNSLILRNPTLSRNIWKRAPVCVLK